jgi:hypothetical protein
MMGETRNEYRVLAGKPLEKLTRRWEDNINMNLRKIGCDDGRWMNWLSTIPNGRLWY